MSNNPPGQGDETADSSFADILKEFETTTSAARQAATPAAKGKGRSKGKRAGPPPRRGTVVGMAGDFVLIDYGEKAEGVIPRADLLDATAILASRKATPLTW